MTDLEKERAKLVSADLAVVEGEMRVRDQMALIQDLRREGEDTALAEAVLSAFQTALSDWQAHREATLKRLARLKASERTK
jgi:hypothetical protein